MDVFREGPGNSILEPRCAIVVDFDGDHCGDPIVIFNIKRDEGQCLRHLVIKKAYPLQQLMLLVDRYWFGEY